VSFKLRNSHRPSSWQCSYSANSTLLESNCLLQYIFSSCKSGHDRLAGFSHRGTLAIFSFTTRSLKFCDAVNSESNMGIKCSGLFRNRTFRQVVGRTVHGSSGQLIYFNLMPTRPTLCRLPPCHSVVPRSPCGCGNHTYRAR
jgi:hypothetical protein